MVDNVRARSVASSVAEPLLAHIAHDHARRIVDCTVLAREHWQLLHNLKSFKRADKWENSPDWGENQTAPKFSVLRSNVEISTYKSNYT